MLLFLFIAFVSAQKLTVPAEWRVAQNGTWMAWPTLQFYGSPVPSVCTMLAYITMDEVAYVLYNNQDERATAISDIKAWNLDNEYNLTVNLDRVVWANVKHTDFWMRDYLLFAKTPSGNTGVVSFGFNCWGYGSVSNLFRKSAVTDSKIAEGVARWMNYPVFPSNVTMEAGGLEFNDESDDPNYKRFGKRLILSEAVILQRQRRAANPSLTKREIQLQFMELFDLDDIIWLPQFRFDRNTQQEYAVPQCDVNNVDPLSPCNIPSSSYYSLPSGGGIVGDESTFNGPQLNPDNQATWVLPPITTNGHTDEFVKWYGPNHVLLAYVPGNPDPRSMQGRTQYRLNVIDRILRDEGIKITHVPTANEKVLQVDMSSDTYTGFLGMTYVTNGAYWNTSNLEGQQVLSVFGKPQKDPADIVSARSYFNVVITNNHVLLPKYNDPRDLEAYQAFYDAFEAPGNPTGKTRKVVQVNNHDTINAGGGGMHCISQNQPQ